MHRFHLIGSDGTCLSNMNVGPPPAACRLGQRWEILDQGPVESNSGMYAHQPAQSGPTDARLGRHPNVARHRAAPQRCTATSCPIRMRRPVSGRKIAKDDPTPAYTTVLHAPAHVHRMTIGAAGDPSADPSRRI